MSIFGKIKDAIFGHEAEARPTPTPLSPTDGARQPQSQAAAPVVDIEQNLDSMPGADRLNWRTSIVDLMKLIGVDSSYEARKALAAEMGRTDYSGSAEDNVWLHRRVMQDLSKHGGKVPAEYTD
ncbi:DUF3597 domain-containing protein [Croceibacterium aestuarii]|uniref:DUF3597 domain-containing protein n=1 Tax=Croceibacterium aestuarii TaxID=3064139 RepID=UPI00272DFFF5|nr:DUF3597 domain-containing protein [Croceibacterium sp. D39]